MNIQQKNNYKQFFSFVMFISQHDKTDNTTTDSVEYRSLPTRSTCHTPGEPITRQGSQCITMFGVHLNPQLNCLSTIALLKQGYGKNNVRLNCCYKIYSETVMSDQEQDFTRPKNIIHFIIHYWLLRNIQIVTDNILCTYICIQFLCFLYVSNC